MEKNYCQKCGRYGFVELHHVLPQCEYGGQGDTAKLCPNCHTDYHQHLGKKNLKGESMEFHFKKYYRWLAGLSVVLLFVIFIFRCIH